MPTIINCQEAERLLAIYTAVLSAFHDCQIPFFAGMVPEDVGDEENRPNREAVFEELSRARAQYWRHVKVHGCRRWHYGKSKAPPDFRHNGRPKSGGSLTSREMQVLKLTCDGLSTKSIATVLNIHFKTAATHRAKLLEKSGTRKSILLYRWALENGYVSLDETRSDNPPKNRR